MTALRTLIEAVEAGEFPHGMNEAARQVFPYHADASADLGLTAAAAFDGSVDAALALMEVVLPGWFWTVMPRMKIQEGPPEMDGWIARVWTMGTGQTTVSNTPARALLLATLKAMEATNAGKE